MATQGIYGRIQGIRSSLIAEVLPVQVFRRSRHSSPQLSVLDANLKRTTDFVIPPVSCLSFRNYSCHSSSAFGRRGSVQYYSQFCFARRPFCDAAIRHSPSKQGISLLSVGANFTAGNRTHLSTVAYSSRRHKKLGVFSGKPSCGLFTNLLNYVLMGSITLPGGMTSDIRHISQGRNSFTDIHTRLSSLQAKKRAQRKKKQPLADSEEEWQVTAYATADEYDLDKLLDGISRQGLYAAATINPDAHDVLHMVATYQLESEHREIYFFREGSVVFWNVAELERLNVLRFIKQYEKGKYEELVVEEECESLTYKYNEGPSKTRLIRDKIMLNPEGPTDMEKYTFSNALAMSVKLGIWEASLDKYIDNIEYVTEELSKTGRVVLSQDQVLQRMGQLFALRHLINLSSDLLDTPDFYWDHEQLEHLYKRISEHLSISKRTSVMNVKLGHCVELMELLKSHLDEKHSSRLEWIIIILIMVEVGFELLHYLERLI